MLILHERSGPRSVSDSFTSNQKLTTRQWIAKHVRPINQTDCNLPSTEVEGSKTSPPPPLSVWHSGVPTVPGRSPQFPEIVANLVMRKRPSQRPDCLPRAAQHPQMGCCYLAVCQLGCTQTIAVFVCAAAFSVSVASLDCSRLTQLCGG